MSARSRLVSLAFASTLALVLPATLMPRDSHAQAIGVSITVAPPPLPVYAQPVIPAPGYLWVPGYWAWGPAGYYWVPGTWVLPPAVGLLWTPGYWAWLNGAYIWHAGYWGPTVGFYGGVNYGFGYFGVGFVGGRWTNGHFFYNRAVNNFGGVHITNVYNAPVHNAGASRVSFNGGQGGTRATPNAAERAAANEHHTDPTALQAQHETAAGQNHGALASVNHGRPTVAATAHAGTFSGAGIVHARAAAPRARPAAAGGPAHAPAHPAGGQQHPAHQAPQQHPQGAPGGHGDDHHP